MTKEIPTPPLAQTSGNSQQLSAQGIAAGIQAGSLSAGRILEQVQRRIEASENHLKAWSHLDFAAAFDAARDLEARHQAGEKLGPLAGVPIGVKDVIDVAGQPTGAGFTPFQNRLAHTDSNIVKQLRAAGAIALGKTTTAQFAAFDPPETVNPWDAQITAGGSSTGSGVAVAAGHVPLALATQTGGSTLKPAAFNGVVGFKPTLGKIAAAGVFPVAQTLDHVGVIATSVTDCELFAEVAIPSFMKAAPNRPPRIGVVQNIDIPIDPPITTATQVAISQLQKAGAQITPVQLPFSVTQVAEVLTTIMDAELWENHRERFGIHKEFYGPLLTARLEKAQHLPAEKITAAYRERQRMIERYDRIWQGIDVLLLPSLPRLAPRRKTTGSSVLLYPFSLVGAPAIALPAGWLDSLPHSVQIAGPRGADANLLAHARWCADHLTF